MLKNILLPTDGSPRSASATAYALWLAEKFGGHIIGQHVIDALLEGTVLDDISGFLEIESELDFPARMREIFTERGEKALEDLSRRCSARQLSHETFLDIGVVPDEICERAKMADVVVLGGQETPRSGLLGRTADIVTRRSPHPVFMSAANFKPVENPLLAYDGSRRAHAAMELAAEFCNHLGIPLTVLHVSKEAAATERIAAEARSYLTSYDIKISLKVDKGYPEQRIVYHIANNDHDLLFIGAYGHRRIIEMVLGSTTEYLLRNSPCPIFLRR